MLEPSKLLAALLQAHETTRLEVVSRVCADLGAGTRAELLRRVQRRMAPAERASFLAMVLKGVGSEHCSGAPRRGQSKAGGRARATHVRVGLAEADDEGAGDGGFADGFADDDDGSTKTSPEALVESLLDELPERLRADLCARSYKSLSKTARGVALRGLEGWEVRRADAEEMRLARADAYAL